MILDVMLPKFPAWKLLKRIRTQNLQLPVLILTAKSTVEEKVAGLDSGASDYLVKPFAFAELSARFACFFAAAPRKAPRCDSPIWR